MNKKAQYWLCGIVKYNQIQMCDLVTFANKFCFWWHLLCAGACVGVCV